MSTSQTTSTSVPKPDPTVDKTLQKLSLEAYIGQLFMSVIIGADDKDALEAYEQNWSAMVKETENGTGPVSFCSFASFLAKERAELQDRYLVSQETTVAAADSSGRAGQVGHVGHLTATQNGKKLSFTTISVLKVVFEGGKRQIAEESFVLQQTGATA